MKDKKITLKKNVGIAFIHGIAKDPKFRDKLKKHLLGAYENNLDEIVDRIASLDDLFFTRKEYDIYLGEARWCYFYGEFIAAINLSCVCAERMLIDLLMETDFCVNKHRLSSEEKENIFSGQLQSKRIKFAFNAKIIDKLTFNSFQKLDKFRQKYIHPNKPLQGKDIYEDAQNAIFLLDKITRICFPYKIETSEKKKLKKIVYKGINLGTP